jgi:lysophospholipase L1-like esterase
VAEEATFSRQLEQMLNRDNKVAEVINMGVGNYNSAMEVELFKAEGLPLDPDLVVLMYYINDLEPTPALGSFSYWLQKHCYLLGFMRSKLKQLQLMGAGPDWLSSYYRQIYAADAPGRQQNSRSLRELVRICQERNIRLLMVNIPDLRRLEHYPFAYATEYIRGLAAENRVPFLDLLPVLEKYPGKALWVSAEDSHANGKANRLVGEALFNMIKADSLLSAR